jgi:putative methionine-R-sulfoxide reductase with GAF domain
MTDGRARTYAPLREGARAIAALPGREARMQAFVALVWPAMAAAGTSWVGFYVEDPGAPEDRGLLLAAREPKPACSPIGLHGACGQCFRAGRPLVVRDVADLGAGYVACDPRDRSELVLPCRSPGGRTWGVLDADSHAIGNFDVADAVELAALLRAAGLDEP